MLFASGVRGSHDDRETISRRLEGHPLGLRLFALTLEEEAKGDPTRLIERVFDTAHAAETDTLDGKLSRLLLFYEQRLPRDHVAVLGLVSLFRAPAPDATLLTLARGLPEVANALGTQTDAALCRVLETIGHDPSADPGPSRGRITPLVVPPGATRSFPSHTAGLGHRPCRNCRRLADRRTVSRARNLHQAVAAGADGDRTAAGRRRLQGRGSIISGPVGQRRDICSAAGSQRGAALCSGFRPRRRAPPGR